jgi:hypothetical protein
MEQMLVHPDVWLQHEQFHPIWKLGDQGILCGRTVQYSRASKYDMNTTNKELASSAEQPH